MDIKNDIKNGVKLVSDAATDAASALIEKSRLRAKANRIRQIIKSDTSLRNQAYIELGRYYYENLRDNAQTEQEELCVVIDKTSLRINKASKKYVEMLSKSSDTKLQGENARKIKEIVTDKAQQVKTTTNNKVADVKQKAKDATSKAKEKATDLTDKAKLTAQDLTVKAKETVADLSEKIEDKVDDFKAFIAPDEDLEDIINGNDELEKMIAEQEQIIAENEIADDEESPQSFEF